MSGIKHIITDVVSYAKKTKKESNKPMFAIIIDIIWCGLYYGASPANYYKFDFYRSNHAIRRTFVTNRISRRMISKFNIHEYIDIYEDKVLFDKEFSKYIGRDWISSCNCTEAEYNEFVANNPKFICKPLDGSQGQGITVYDGNAPKFGGGDEIFQGQYVLKGFIKQHEKLEAFYDKAVSCIRVITVLADGKVNPIVANITFGSEYEIANASFGGITCEIDLGSGTLVSDGGQYGQRTYVTHPYSGEKFKGFVIPFWNETLEMLSEAGQKVPQVGYIGWDVAITPDGPVIIEGNTTPGYTYFQIPQLLENGKGTIDKYKPYL